MKCTFEYRGMDHMLTSADMLKIPAFKEAVNASYRESFWKEKIKDHQSILIYNLVKGGFPCPEYLASDKGTYRAVQLKFKLRTGVLGIGADLHLQHRVPGLCVN